MTLGEKLKMYRTQKGLSQEKVAELIGVSRQAVTKWESNQTRPNSDNLIALSDIYDISLDELVLDKQKEQKTAKQDNTILHSNLTLIAIIMQVSFLNVAMQPFQDMNIPALRIAELIIKFVPLLASSLWMSFNLRYEKNLIQRRKNAQIELLYCIIQITIVFFGHYSRLYLAGTLLLIAAALFYIFHINPNYMNRQLTKKKDKHTKHLK